MRTNFFACLCAVSGLALVGCPGPAMVTTDAFVNFADTNARDGGPRDSGPGDAGPRDTGTVDAFAANDTGVALDTGPALDAGVTDDAFVLVDAFAGIDAFSTVDAFSATDAGRDAFVATDAFTAMDAGVASDAGRDAFAFDANRDAFVGTDAFHGDAFLGPCAPPTHLVINEIDYDQTGAAADAAEFVEIFNPTSAAVNLATMSVVLVNGAATGTPASAREYVRVALTGMIPAGGYVVVTAPASSTGAFGVALPAMVTRFTFSGTGLTDRIQNGAPDAVVLMDGTTVVDAASYEGSVASFLPATGATPMTMIMENASIGADSNTDNGSLSRRPNGCDRDMPMMDWYFTPTITAGALNP